MHEAVVTYLSNDNSSNIPFYLEPRQEALTIIFVMLILACIYLAYFVKLRKLKPNQAPTGFVLVIQMYIAYIRNLVVEILGEELVCLTPYFVHLFSYIALSNVIGIIGLANPTSSLTVTLSMGIVMFVGTFVIGFKYQKLNYLKKFTYNIKIRNKSIPVMLNPNEIVGQITPLISISFRLWGNIFAGGLIGELWYFFWGYITSSKSFFLSAMNIFGAFSVIPINMYFDLLSGVIQALVFTLLTMIYWTLQKQEGHEENNHEPNKKIKIKANSALDLD
ncbi:MAG: ATP synthase F0 sector subunit a [Candidatus Malacoplasma girerdii]|nr:MAG: ATP synthase F0 sector subunit a [Candidatus Malacoplasma girerdii]